MSRRPYPDTCWFDRTARNAISRKDTSALLKGRKHTAATTFHSPRTTHKVRCFLSKTSRVMYSFGILGSCFPNSSLHDVRMRSDSRFPSFAITLSAISPLATARCALDMCCCACASRWYSSGSAPALRFDPSPMTPLSAVAPPVAPWEAAMDAEMVDAEVVKPRMCPTGAMWRSNSPGGSVTGDPSWASSCCSVTKNLGTIVR
mmetsp:Transcript_5370/g.17312  ORF Transcript_5370/g.17312 Transcript_5370/m.17312 type:complete len:203 (+) Transcript_5370:824-1432(+)